MLETHHTPPLSVRVMFARTQTSPEGKVSEDFIKESKRREIERERGGKKEMVAISLEESVAN